MSSKKFYLFSAVQRCAPCRSLIQYLNYEFPEWEDYIEYINADESTPEQMELARKLKVMSLPTFTDDKEIIFKGFALDTAQEIKKLCLTKQ